MNNSLYQEEALEVENRNLTQIETIGLKFDYNLADAHTHQSQSPTQEDIVKRFPEIFDLANKTKQHELNLAAIKAYHALAQQHTVINTNRSLICYSSSVAMEIVANFLRKRRWKVMLIEPTFDNIADILKRHGVSLLPLEDILLGADKSMDFYQYLDSCSFDALFLTLPNNPTGMYLSKQDFEVLANYCHSRSLVLILDTCFRIFEPNAMYDQYAILEYAQVDYIVIEDTGKIWPTLDLKVGFLNPNSKLFDSLRNIHSDFLLNVSPFILQLIQEYCKDSKQDDFNSVRGLVSDNREFLRTQLDQTILQSACKASSLSVELLEILNSLKATELYRILSLNGVYVLPGNHFYWNSPQKGDKFIRVALARDRELFQNAVRQIVAVLNRSFLPELV